MNHKVERIKIFYRYHRVWGVVNWTTTMDENMKMLCANMVYFISTICIDTHYAHKYTQPTHTTAISIQLQMGFGIIKLKIFPIKSRVK